jgi:predicted AAA+ superfamily ATPase
MKSYLHSGVQPRISFFRDSNKTEIDFVLEENMTLYPIEVKQTTMPNANDARSFPALKNGDKKISTGAIICLCDKITSLPNKDVICIPAWEI